MGGHQNSDPLDALRGLPAGEVAHALHMGLTIDEIIALKTGNNVNGHHQGPVGGEHVNTDCPEDHLWCHHGMDYDALMEQNVQDLVYCEENNFGECLDALMDRNGAGSSEVMIDFGNEPF